MDMKNIGIGAAVVLLLFFGASYFFDLQIEGIGAPPTTTLAAAVVCPDDGITTLNVKLWDDFAATGTYIASATLYAKNLNTEIIEATTTSSSSAWATMNVDCSTDGITYVVYAVAVAGDSGSAISEPFVATGNNMYFNLHTNKINRTQIRIKDITGDDFEFLFPDATTTDASNTSAYSDLNATNVFESAAGDDIEVGDGGYLDMYIYLRSNVARHFANDKGEIGETGIAIGFRNFICVRQGTDNAWTKDSVIIAVDDGSSLPNIITQIDDDSREHTYIDNSFFCAEIGDISDTPKKIRFYISSDENPDSDGADITLYFFGEGFYLSSDTPDIINTGVFTDASTQVGVVYDAGEVPYLVIYVS